jgi:hypothetical protein
MQGTRFGGQGVGCRCRVKGAKDMVQGVHVVGCGVHGAGHRCMV